MNWGSRKRGDRRIIKKYAWFPIRIENSGMKKKIEWRWLEKVKIRQEYEYVIDDSFNLIDDIRVYLFGGYWKNECFMEFDLDEKRDNILKKLGI